MSSSVDLSISHKPIHTSCCEPSIPNTRCSVITVVALLGIAATVVGILATLASTMGVSGLGVLNTLGWHGGVALTGTGLVIFAGLIIEAVVRHTSAPKKEKAASSVQISLLDQTSPTDSIPKPANQLDIYVLARSLGIYNLKKHLNDVYGPDHHPDFYQTPLEADADTIVRWKFQLLTHTQFLDLPLTAFNEYSSFNLKVVYDRLMRLDQQKAVYPVSPMSDPTTITLGQLRVLARYDISFNLIPIQCRGMMTAAQVESILSPSAIQGDALMKWLPLGESQWYTQYRLQSLNPATIGPYLPYLRYDYFRMLPLRCFKADNFPWDVVTSSSKNVTTLFGIGRIRRSSLTLLDCDFTQGVFAIVDIKAIQKLASHLSPEYLSFFTQEHIKHPDFPWGPFMKDKSVGNALRCLTSTVLAASQFPWGTFANTYPDALTQLLGTEMHKSHPEPEYRKDFTLNLLKLLNIKNIQAIAPALSLKHLALMPEAHLKHPDFPWSDFIDRPGIHEALHDVKSTVLVASHIPWTRLATTPEAVQQLFNTEEHRLGEQEWGHVFTQNILSKLNFTVIPVFAPLLTPKHLVSFGDKLLEPDFPWSSFFTHEGLGREMHDSKFPIQVFALAHFPWLDFPKKEIEELLPTAYNTTRTTQILKAIPQPTLEAMKQKDLVEEEHLKLLKA